MNSKSSGKRNVAMFVVAIVVVVLIIFGAFVLLFGNSFTLNPTIVFGNHLPSLFVPLNIPLNYSMLSNRLSDIFQSISSNNVGQVLIGKGGYPPYSGDANNKAKVDSSFNDYTSVIILYLQTLQNCTVVGTYGSIVERDVGTVIYNYSLVKNSNGIHLCGISYPLTNFSCMNELSLANGINALENFTFASTFVPYIGTSTNLTFYMTSTVNQTQYNNAKFSCKTSAG